MNTPGSFLCMCNRGYIYDENSHQCIDNNECLRNPCEGNAQCINLPGSFECKCPEGYKHGKLNIMFKYICFGFSNYYLFYDLLMVGKLGSFVKL